MVLRVLPVLMVFTFSQAAVAAEPDARKAAAEVTTQAVQASLTADQIINRLKAGNERFRNGQMVRRDLPAHVKSTAAGQYPYAVILSCLDSRIPVEDVFDQGIGDVFVARVAGNIVNPEILGSMEFATHVVGSKVIVVLGHTRCGAVQGACDGVDLGNVTRLVERIQPSVKAVAGDTCSSKKAGVVDAVAHHNVERTLADIRAQSAVIRDLEAAGKVKLVGAMYDVATGQVQFK